MTGNPTPILSWSRDDFPLSSSERNQIETHVTSSGDVISNLTIHSVTIEDGGDYICRGSNVIGAIEHIGRLNVYGE